MVNPLIRWLLGAEEASRQERVEALLKAAGTLTPDSAQLEDLQIRVERAGATRN